MKAILDTSVFISFLLGGGVDSPPSRAVISGIRGTYTIVCNHQLISELERRVTSKPYLAARIPKPVLDTLVRALLTEAELITEDPVTCRAISRDRNDDYLLIDATRANANYLVTGDRDLLVLGEFDGVRIVSPAAFVDLLDD